jgi:hypothetical protein
MLRLALEHLNLSFCMIVVRLVGLPDHCIIYRPCPCVTGYELVLKLAK